MKNSHLLVIGDIHNKIKLADSYIKRFPNIPIIFTGDYFDDFGDDARDAQATAEWLKESLSHPERIHLIGNHDLPYMLNGRIFCPGWSEEKQKVVNKVLTQEDWSKLKFFHYERDYYFSHAGLTEHWFGHPVTGGITPELTQLNIDNARPLLDSMSENCIWAADSYRGGLHTYGSLLWCDWRNLDHIDNINQIVGHTPARKIIRSTCRESNSDYFNVDCFLKEVLLFSSKNIPTIVKQFDV
jgi:hypothetical protein